MKISIWLASNFVFGGDVYPMAQMDKALVGLPMCPFLTCFLLYQTDVCTCADGCVCWNIINVGDNQSAKGDYLVRANGVSPFQALPFTATADGVDSGGSGTHRTQAQLLCGQR